jgi:hypothetical protein
MADPIILAAQARPLIEGLHKRNDVVVRFKSDKSGFAEDAVTDDLREEPGHFRAEKRDLNVDIDTLIGNKPMPSSLATIEDWRQYPVLAGVVAHESAHARFSLWDTEENPIPATIPNPDYEEDFDPTGKSVQLYANGHEVPTEFEVSETGRLYELAKRLEEPRVERLGVNAFTKTWRRAMTFSAGHLTLESIETDEEEIGYEKDALDEAVDLAILVGGRQVAGTLGTTPESRKAVKKVLDGAQSVIEKALANQENAVEDPYHKIMQIVSKQVFNNDHEDATSHLEAARQILKIIHPESEHEPDKQSQGGGAGEAGMPGPGEDEGEEGDGNPTAGAGMSAELAEALEEMKEAMSGFSTEMQEMVEKDEDWNPDSAGGGGHGSVIYNNPAAPQVDRMELPTQADRDLRKRASEWMQQQIEPTVTEFEYGQWLPSGGARLDVRSYVRDDLAEHVGNQRSDWEIVTEQVKAAPPVKVAIMLDGSGSMRPFARTSASIAWAAANAAADLPEARTVSVVYGNAAALTQAPGHAAPRQVAVSKTNGSTEDFIGAAKIVEEALWLDEPMEEGMRSNVLVVIISDLQYGGEYKHPSGRREGQFEGFMRITQEWADKGYTILVVGSDERQFGYMVEAEGYNRKKAKKTADQFTIVTPEALFT